MNLSPLGARVLIKRKDVTKIGSIIVPETSREAKFNLGEVVAVGPECDFLKDGDLVTFGQYAPLILSTKEMEYYGIDVSFEPDTTYLLMNEVDVLCIITGDEPAKEE